MASPLFTQKNLLIFAALATTVGTAYNYWQAITAFFSSSFASISTFAATNYAALSAWFLTLPTWGMALASVVGVVVLAAVVVGAAVTLSNSANLIRQQMSGTPKADPYDFLPTDDLALKQTLILYLDGVIDNPEGTFEKDDAVGVRDALIKSNNGQVALKASNDRAISLLRKVDPNMTGIIKELRTVYARSHDAKSIQDTLLVHSGQLSIIKKLFEESPSSVQYGVGPDLIENTVLGLQKIETSLSEDDYSTGSLDIVRKTHEHLRILEAAGKLIKYFCDYHLNIYRVALDLNVVEANSQDVKASAEKLLGQLPEHHELTQGLEAISTDPITTPVTTIDDANQLALDLLIIYQAEQFLEAAQPQDLDETIPAPPSESEFHVSDNEEGEVSELEEEAVSPPSTPQPLSRTQSFGSAALGAAASAAKAATAVVMSPFRASPARGDGSEPLMPLATDGLGQPPAALKLSNPPSAGSSPRGDEGVASARIEESTQDDKIGLAGIPGMM